MFPEAWRTAWETWLVRGFKHTYLHHCIYSIQFRLILRDKNEVSVPLSFPSYPFPFPSFPILILPSLCFSPPFIYSLLSFPSFGLWLASVSAASRLWPTHRCPHPSTQILPTGCVMWQRVIRVVARIQVLNQPALESGDCLQSSRRTLCRLWCI